MYHFRDTILAPIDNNSSEPEQVQGFFVMNGDVCADFPLEDMLNLHLNDNYHQLNEENQPVIITVMATETTRQQSINYGI